MSWPCYQIECVLLDPHVPIPGKPDCFYTRLYRVAGKEELIPFDQLQVGAIWKDAERGVCVKLPGGHGGRIWAMEEPGYPTSNKWTVTGEIPNVSATPSINCVGSYHGWVRNGIVTDDCEGRKFDDFGSLLE